MRRGTPSLIVAAIAAVALLAPAAASADTARSRVVASRAPVPTNLTILASQINPKTEIPAQIDFNGKVQSTPKCRRGRKVNVFKVRPGKDLKVGSDRSNRKGNWYVPGEVPGTPNSNGTYYAKTPRDRKGDTVCAPDRSQNHVADQQQPRR